MTPCSKRRCAPLLPPHARRCALPLPPLGWRENLPPLSGESNALGRSHAQGCFERYFPLTPALSLGERENRARPFRQSRAPRLVATRGAVFPLSEGEGDDAAPPPPLALSPVLRIP